MRPIFVNFVIFSLIWLQHGILAEPKVKFELVFDRFLPGEVLNDCRLREPDLQREYGFLRKLQNPRLKHYLHSYFSRREQFTDVESPKARIIQTEFITNEYGEYSFSSELNNGIQRTEIGAFEPTENGYEFVVRGIFYIRDILWIFKSSVSELSIEPYRNVSASKAYILISPDHVPHAATIFLCSCCMQYGICSKKCDFAAAPAKECSAPVTPNENLPKIREQWLKTYENNSYELRVEFENGFYERAEFVDVYGKYSQGNVFGYFPDPDNPGVDLQYYLQGLRIQFYIRPENFPDTIYCKYGSAGVPGGDKEYEMIDVQVLKSSVG